MSVLVRVDNVTYQAVGLTETPQTGAILPSQMNLTNRVISPTQTKFIMEAGKMQFNLTFLNPIEVRTGVTRRCHAIYLLILSLQPEDWVKQSIPFSYLSLTAKSLDGAVHTVQVYSDFDLCERGFYFSCSIVSLNSCSMVKQVKRDLFFVRGPRER